MLPNLIAAKTNVSADLIRQILDMEKGLLKKQNPVKLFKPDRDESQESNKQKSTKSLPPFQDDSSKDFLKQIKNSTFKRSYSGRKLKKPLEFIKHLSKKELPELKKRNKRQGFGDLSLKSISNLDFLKSLEKNKLNKFATSVKKNNLKDYLESIDESKNSYSMTNSKISKQNDVIMEGAFTKLTKTFFKPEPLPILKSKTSNTKKKTNKKGFKKRNSDAGPNNKYNTNLLAKNVKKSSTTKNKITSNIGFRSKKNKSQPKKNNLPSKKPIRRNSKDSKISNLSSKKTKQSTANKNKAKVLANGKNLSSNGSKVDKKQKKVTFPKTKKYDPQSKIKKWSNEDKKQKRNSTISAPDGSLFKKDTDEHKIDDSFSYETDEDPFADEESKDSTIKELNKNEIPTLPVPKRQSMRKLLAVQNNAEKKDEKIFEFEKRNSKDPTDLITPSFPVNRRFTAESSEIRDLLGKPNLKSMSSNLAIIQENAGKNEISSNKLIFSLESKKPQISLKQSTFNNYFLLESCSDLESQDTIKKDLHNNGVILNQSELSKKTSIDSSTMMMKSSAFVKKNITESQFSIARKATKPKKKRVLLNSVIKKYYDLEETEKKTMNNKMFLDTSNENINLQQFAMKSYTNGF